MTITVKILLTAALILSIAVPFGAFAAGEKTKGRYKAAIAANAFSAPWYLPSASCLAEMPMQQRQPLPLETPRVLDILPQPSPPGFPVSAAVLPYQLQLLLPWEPSVRILPFLVSP